MDKFKEIQGLPKNLRQIMVRTCRIIKARNSFYYFCKALHTDIYRDDVKYLRHLCDSLQKLYERRLINKKTGEPYLYMTLSLLPRHYKSFTLGLFQCWMIGKDHTKQGVTVCYNEILSRTFAKTVRNRINTKKAKGNKSIIFSDIFPKCKIKKGSASVQAWQVEGARATTFLATSPKGTVTGFGSNGVIIVDDPVKNAEEAANEDSLRDWWVFFRNTLLSRAEGQCVFIINMTRWSDNDLVGMVKQSEMADKWYSLEYEAYNEETDEMLNPYILTKQHYEMLKRNMSAHIFNANYQQKPIQLEGKLYKKFQTYSPQKLHFNVNNPNNDIRFMCDPSDGKGDNLCGITYVVKDKLAYVIDIYYTNKPEDINPKRVADRIIMKSVKRYKIETNKGASFAIQVKEKLTEARHAAQYTELYTSENKQVKIMSWSTWVQEFLFFPEDWAKKWPAFYFDLWKYMSTGKNKTDDAADVCSMIAEDVAGSNSFTARKIIPIGNVIDLRSQIGW